MFQATFIGNLGSDAKVTKQNGRDYVSFRVAHTDKFTKSDGTVVENTTWASCFLIGIPNVVPYLKKGVKVYVCGNARLDIYSSPKTKRMECGITINVNHIELCGGTSDEVPRQLFDDNGVVLNVSKHYWVNVQGKAGSILRNKAMQEFILDDNGFVKPLEKASGSNTDSVSEVNNEVSTDDALPFI